MCKAVSASTTSIAAGQTLGGAGDLNLTGTAVNDGSNMASTVTLTSSGNISGVNFTITGTDSTGATVSEVKAGPNAGTVTTTQAFLTVTSIAANGAVGTNTSAGFTATTTTHANYYYYHYYYHYYHYYYYNHYNYYYNYKYY